LNSRRCRRRAIENLPGETSYRGAARLSAACELVLSKRVNVSPIAQTAVPLWKRLCPTALLFPAAEGGPVGLDTWRTRAWYPALDAAGIPRRGSYHLRHTFATEALAAGVSTSHAGLRVMERTGIEPVTSGLQSPESEKRAKRATTGSAARSL
jgi:integrase